MEKDKRELIELIESIKNPKMITYLLGLITAFIEIRK